MITEAEAKAKWCPFARVRREDRYNGRDMDDYSVVNRGTDAPTHCIGSACMAWRCATPEAVPASSRLGYCGLAGKP